MRGPTTDHGEILAWATRHHAVPAEVLVLKFDGQPSILRFLFGELPRGTPEIHPIAWDDFFARFDLLGLALVYDDSPDFQILEIEERSAYRRHLDPF